MLYRWAFPICGIGGILFVFFAYFGTEERTVVHKQYVAKVKFTEGAKQLLTNKYFWIITIFSYCRRCARQYQYVFVDL